MSENCNDKKGKLEVVASKSFNSHNVLVEVVDFLNKSLKRDGYIFGVSKSSDRMTIVIYETDKIPRD